MFSKATTDQRVISSRLDQLIIDRDHLRDFNGTSRWRDFDGNRHQKSYREGFEAARIAAAELNSLDGDFADYDEVVNRCTSRLGWTAMVFCRMVLEYDDEAVVHLMGRRQVSLFGYLLERVAETMSINTEYAAESDQCDIDRLIDAAMDRTNCYYATYNSKLGVMDESRSRPFRAIARTQLSLFITRRAYEELYYVDHDFFIRFVRAIHGVFVIMGRP